MSDRYSWAIRAGSENGDERELSLYNDEETAQKAFSKLDSEDVSKFFDWVQLIKIDWYKRCESVVDEIVR